MGRDSNKTMLTTTPAGVVSGDNANCPKAAGTWLICPRNNVRPSRPANRRGKTSATAGPSSRSRRLRADTSCGAGKSRTAATMFIRLTR